MDKRIDFKCYIEPKKCIDSMLFDAETIIAELTYNNKVTISLEVSGDINIKHKNKTYTSATEYTKELKDLIISDGIYADGVEVINYNEFRLTCYNKNNLVFDILYDKNLTNMNICDLCIDLVTYLEYEV